MARAAFFFFLTFFISTYLICQVLAQDNNSIDNNNNGNNGKNTNDSGNNGNGNNNNGSNNNNVNNNNGSNNNNVNTNNDSNNNNDNNKNNNGNNNNSNNNNNGNNNSGGNNNNDKNNSGNDDKNGNNNNGNDNNGNTNNDNFDYSHIKPVDVGVNWGNLASHPLPAKIIVQMLKDNGIKRVKLFDADENSVKALANTGIDVMVAIPNGMLYDMAVDYSNAQDWVKENVTRWVKDSSVRIKYVAVGNEPFLKSYNDSFINDTFPALKNVQQALVKAGHGKTVKAIVPLNADVYESPSNLPSDGAFRKDVKVHIDNILKNLHDHDSPFVVNIYPFLSISENPDFPVEFAFFEQGGKALQDKNNRYTNVLDGNYDTLLTALKKAGVPDLKIIIGEIGWPTDGHSMANTKNAQRFYDGLFKKLGKRDGTPLRPGTEFDVYLFGFLDEDAKSIAPGDFERHWGIFRFDGQAKFPIDFTGRGHNKMPTGAKDVKYYSSKWCVFDTEVKNFDMVGEQLKKACAEGDCTATSPGSSCAGLDNLTKISYAFNMYYQMNKQSDKACDFEGMAFVTDKNASVGNCYFPIQIDSAAVSLLNFATGAAAMAATVAGILFTILM